MPVRNEKKEYLCVTDYGHRYVVNIEEEKIDNGKGKFITIMIGSHSDLECINISLRLDKIRLYPHGIITTNPYLHFFNPRSTCELTGKSIEGELTLKFLILGLNILREIVPQASNIEFWDDSVLRLDADTRLSLKKAYILFYGDTWYGKKFGARPIEGTYHNIIMEGLNREDIKDKPLDDGVPEEYYNGILELRSWDDFRDELTSELNLILDQSNTWGEFFKEVAKLPNKYRLIEPWLDDIFAAVFKNKLNDILNNNWVINIDEAIARYPPVRYEKTLISSGGGIRRSRRRRKSIRL